MNRRNRRQSHRQITSEFIQCYRRNTVLWDTSRKDYFDQQLKKEAYAKLLEIYQKFNRGGSVENVKRKINVLRTNYRKDVRKVKKAVEEGVKVHTSWYYKEMDFLLNFYNVPQVPSSAPSATIVRNMKVEDDVSDLSSDSSNRLVVVENDSDRGEDKDAENVPQTPMEPIDFKPLIKIESTLPKHIKHSHKSHKSNGNRHTYQAEETEEMVIAKNWTFKLGRLRTQQRIWAELFINNILTEGELGTLHRHFMSTTFPVYQTQNDMLN